MDQDIGAVYGVVVGASFPSFRGQPPSLHANFICAPAEMKTTIPLFPLTDLACRAGIIRIFRSIDMSDHHQ
jgi:hypothetical protein